MVFYDVSRAAGIPEREPVALVEDLVELVVCPLAETRRPARAQRAPALGTALFIGTGLPACEPHGVARDVLQGIDRGEEAADQVRGTDHAVLDGLRSTGAGAAAVAR